MSSSNGDAGQVPQPHQFSLRELLLAMLVLAVMVASVAPTLRKIPSLAEPNVLTGVGVAFLSVVAAVAARFLHRHLLVRAAGPLLLAAGRRLRIDPSQEHAGVSQGAQLRAAVALLFVFGVVYISAKVLAELGAQDAAEKRVAWNEWAALALWVSIFVLAAVGFWWGVGPRSVEVRRDGLLLSGSSFMRWPLINRHTINEDRATLSLFLKSKRTVTVDVDPEVIDRLRSVLDSIDLGSAAAKQDRHGGENDDQERQPYRFSVKQLLLVMLATAIVAAIAAPSLRAYTRQHGSLALIGVATATLGAIVAVGAVMVRRHRFIKREGLPLLAAGSPSGRRTGDGADGVVQRAQESVGCVFAALWLSYWFAVCATFIYRMTGESGYLMVFVAIPIGVFVTVRALVDGITSRGRRSVEVFRRGLLLNGRQWAPWNSINRYVVARRDNALRIYHKAHYMSEHLVDLVRIDELVDLIRELAPYLPGSSDSDAPQTAG